MGSCRILFISNGHGEDLIASAVIKEFKGLMPHVQVQVAPLVGVGRSYAELDVEVVIPVAAMPSGGFIKRNFKALWGDIRAGFLGLVRRQAAALRRSGLNVDMVVAVGDAYPLLMAGLLVKKPLIFVPTAKSDYIAPHLPVEISLMRRWAKLVLPRDAKTSQGLSREGVKAEYVGNVMMDALIFTGERFGIPEDRQVITLLPGSRGEAYRNLRYLLDVVKVLDGLGSFDFIVSMAPGLDIEEIGRELAQDDWKIELRQSAPVVGEIVGGINSRIQVVQGVFGDTLNVAHIVIGMAGTGNEQAVGIGKPVVTFPGDGPQFTQAFAEVQKRLLGDSISAMPRDPERVAREVLAILNDGQRYANMQRIGKERMGEPGASRRMASAIIDLLQREILSK
jgi:uncharacterized protein (TIGR03492 family)